MNVHKLHLAAALCFTLPIGCGGPEGPEAAIGDEAVGEEDIAEQASGLPIEPDPCARRPWLCEPVCSPSYTYAEPGFAICHFDQDMHWDGIDIEFYVADRYHDNACNSGDAYRKREIAQVHCGWSTSSSECERKVTRRLQELAAYGYYPVVADVDQDICPRPRI